MDMRHAAQPLDDGHRAGEHRRGPFRSADMLRPDAELRRRAGRRRRAAAGRRHPFEAEARHRNEGVAAIAPDHVGVENVHPRRADEAGDEQVVRVLVEVEGRADLLDPAGIQHRDAVGQRHRLHLVVGDVDHRRAQRLVQTGDLDAHADAELGVEIGERLVEQEDLRLAHDRPADRHALALAARKFARLALQERLQPQDPRGLRHLGVDLPLRLAGHLERKAHIGRHRHVRIERVGLEHHGDAALGRILVGDVAAADLDPALAYPLQPGDHPQQGRFPAAGRPDEHQELAIRDG